MPTGYEYREYKNWRGIPRPRRCPFCNQAKGEIRKANRMYQGVCPNCGATGPKQPVSPAPSNATEPFFLLGQYFILVVTA